MTAVVHKISVGAGGNTLSPEESLRRSASLGNYAHNTSRAIEYACLYGGEDNKERIQ